MSRSIIIIALLFCVLVVLVVTDTMSSPQNSEPVITEMPYTLSDGTPCVILRGGTHSSYIGVSCNYSSSKE